MTRARRNTDVDAKFGIPEDPPELKARLVSVIGGEVTDAGLLPQALRNLETKVGELAGGIAEMRGDVKTLVEKLAPVIADHGKRITDLERRVADLEAAKRKKRK
jgi:hypothetical protein